MLAVEVIGGFDYSVLDGAIAERVQGRLNRMRQLYRQSVHAAVEIGLELLALKKDLVEEKLYRRWIETEFPWGKSSANQFEKVAERFAHVQNLDMFEVSALYVLAAPSTSPEIRQKAIALAEAGERITHARAKALKSGSDLLLLKPEREVLVQNGPYQGQPVVVKSAGKSEGLVSVVTSTGEATLLLSELMPEEAESKPAKARKHTPNHLEAIATELEIERDRGLLLEDVLRRICAAARAGLLTDQLLREAEELLA